MTPMDWRVKSRTLIIDWATGAFYHASRTPGPRGHAELQPGELLLGGSLGRKEATGFGTVYFAGEMLQAHADDLEGAGLAAGLSGNL